MVHKAGTTILWHLQKTQYLRYWTIRRGAGGWTENADVDAHAAACRRVRKSNSRGMSCAHNKEMNSRYPTLDVQHQRNSKYEPSILEAETFWSRDAIDRWVEGCADLVAENIKKTLSGTNTHEISKRFPGTRPVDTETVQGLTLRRGAQQQDVQRVHIEAYIRYWRS